MTNTFRIVALAALVAAGSSGCANMSKGTVAGAGIGGVTGAVLSGGSATGAAVGAVVGGVVGREVEKRDR